MHNHFESKLDSANLLILGIEGLRPTGLLPVSRAAIEDAGAVQAALDHQKLGASLSSVVLYAIVVELVVKHIWEQERGTPAMRTHDIHSLFLELRPETRRNMIALYEKCCLAYKSAVHAGQEQKGPDAVAVDIASFEEALRWNEDAVKNFKYKLTPRGKSVPTGMFWSSERWWIVPNTFPNFAVELTRWASPQMFRGHGPS